MKKGLAHDVAVINYRNINAIVGDSISVGGQRGLICTGKINNGETIFRHTGPILSERTWLTVQVGHNAHLEVGELGRHTNHSCNPNARVSTKIHEDGTATVSLIAVRDISQEEVCFDYATTETNVTAGLRRAECLCGSANCRGHIFGFYELSESERKRLQKAGLLAEHLSCFE